MWTLYAARAKSIAIEGKMYVQSAELRWTVTPEVIGVNDDEILAMDLDEIIKRFKELGGWTYRSSNLDMVFVVYMIARAVEKIAYAKGLKKGKSIGSHQAYSHFVKHGYWEESKCLDDCFGRVLAANFLVKHQPRLNYINTVRIVGQKWMVMSSETY